MKPKFRPIDPFHVTNGVLLLVILLIIVNYP